MNWYAREQEPRREWRGSRHEYEQDPYRRGMERGRNMGSEPYPGSYESRQEMGGEERQGYGPERYADEERFGGRRAMRSGMSGQGLPEREFYAPSERRWQDRQREERDFTRSGWGSSAGRQLGAGAFEPRGDEWHGGAYGNQGYGNQGYGNQGYGYGNQGSYEDQGAFGSQAPQGQRWYGNQGHGTQGSFERAGQGGFGQERGRQGRHYGKGPRNYKRSDDRIREEISDRLMEHPDIDASQVDVEVSDGEVVLRGTVEERHVKRELEDLAERVLGVRDVNNQVRVRSREESGSENEESRQTTTGKRQQHAQKQS
jgi:osmotically-inducible protein OsmY